jgi:hypothetical protein
MQNLIDLLFPSRNEDDPNTFLDLRVSTASKEYVRLRGSYYHPESGFGVFALVPLISEAGSVFFPFFAFLAR